MKSAVRVGGRSVMMCGDDGGNVVVRKEWVQKWFRVLGCGWWFVCGHKKIFFVKRV